MEPSIGSESSLQMASRFNGRQITDKQDITDNHTTEISLTVSCYCERGKHRSVAFVEELGRKPWPKEWVVEIVHRDVDVQRDKNGAKTMNVAGSGRKQPSSARTLNDHY